MEEREFLNRQRGFFSIPKVSEAELISMLEDESAVFVE
jgi:hypothetical protein